jgi:hypothetical protein
MSIVNVCQIHQETIASTFKAEGQSEVGFWGGRKHLKGAVSSILMINGRYW